jgi:hypothetical protein
VVAADAACGDKQIAAATLTSAGAATAGITIRAGLRWRPKGFLPELFAPTGKALWGGPKLLGSLRSA